MGFEYVNRRGDRYYLLQGTTKTGKPKYYMARKAEGAPVERVPEGYEIYEHPERGLVSVRKVRRSQVLPGEREMLCRWTRQLGGSENFLVDLQGDSLVVYTPGEDPAAAAAGLCRGFGLPAGREASVREYLARRTNYTAMLRFTLTDAEKRLYTAERWCFRGAVEDWIPLSGPRPLVSLAKAYLPHLHRESFFDLM
jgi:hypothetical protein